MHPSHSSAASDPSYSTPSTNGVPTTEQPSGFIELLKLTGKAIAGAAVITSVGLLFGFGAGEGMALALRRNGLTPPETEQK